MLIRVCVVVAVAVSDMVIALPIATTVVPDGTPVPVIGCPTVMPLMLDGAVMLALPLVRMPKKVVWLVAVAGAEMTMLVPLEDTTVAFEGMPVPLIAAPFTILVRADTPVMVVLPLVT